MLRVSPRLTAVGALIGMALAAACSNTLGPPAAASANAVDTVTLFTLSDTAVATPSAYDIELNQKVRTDMVSTFDFAVNVVSGQAELFPTGALVGMARASALQYSGQTFDQVLTAPGSGWNDSTALSVSVGTVVLVRSRAITCSYGATVFEYAKLQVLAVDTLARQVNFQILTNTNCGYRDLQLGIPKH